MDDVTRFRALIARHEEALRDLKAQWNAGQRSQRGRAAIPAVRLRRIESEITRHRNAIVDLESRIRYTDGR